MEEDVVVENKINLVLMNDTAYVWTTKDWLKLRSLRIVGNFVGSLAALPRQDQIAGLPLALSKEETTILLERNYAALKSLPHISNPPTQDVKLMSATCRQKLLSEQTEILVNKRKQEIESKIDVIIKGKRAKLNRSNPEESTEINREEVLQKEFSKIQPPKQTNLAVQTSTDDPWLVDSDFQDASWNYPTSPEENLRYAVFRDLYDQGYYITAGGKFGGDYLAYPGDPVKFHAFFVIICVDKDEKIGMSEIIRYGRLGQSVRKTVALASVNDKNEVEYQSIQWSGS